MSKYNVWECKIVVPANSDMPEGFDGPPRFAAEQAVLEGGVEVIAILSGWGGQLTDIELDVLDKQGLLE